MSSIPWLAKTGSKRRLPSSMHQVGNKSVCLLDRLLGLIDEPGLDLLPAVAETLNLLVREQRSFRLASARLPSNYPCRELRHGRPHARL
jgi:predicted component of type VI protein secretion system